MTVLAFFQVKTLFSVPVVHFYKDIVFFIKKSRSDRSEHLQNVKPLLPQYKMSEDEWRNNALYDAYFSNNIEGTDFLVDEAKSIFGLISNANPGFMASQPGHSLENFFKIYAT